jgi:ABC-type phosphate transport system permease subunit
VKLKLIINRIKAVPTIVTAFRLAISRSITPNTADLLQQVFLSSSHSNLFKSQFQSDSIQFGEPYRAILLTVFSVLFSSLQNVSLC